jgi:hypothetical protein
MREKRRREVKKDLMTLYNRKLVSVMTFPLFSLPKFFQTLFGQI